MWVANRGKMKDNRILIVDDEAINRTLIKTVLSKEDYTLFFAVNGVEAIEILAKEDIDVVLLDLMMPIMDGYETLRTIKADPKLTDVQVIMITALSERSVLKETLKLGADEFLNKPFDIEELKIRIKNVLKLKKYIDRIKDVNINLEKIVNEKTAEIQTSIWMIKKSEQDIVSILGRAGEYRDTDTGNHVARMSHYCAILAKKINMSESEQETVLLAAPLHDIGKIGIPDNILLKPGKLTEEEFDIMKTHAQIGYEILGSKNTPLLQAAKIIALTHHEKWDGTGYPNGTAGEDIHIYGRICAIADVFDALVSKRPYKNPFSLEDAISIMQDGKGKHFDPKLLDIFIECMPEILEIKLQFD